VVSLVSKELAKQQEKVRAFKEAEDIASKGISVVDKDLYERHKRKELAVAIFLVVEVVALLVIVYYAGRSDALNHCVDMLVNTNGLTIDAAKVACKTVVGL
jgi:hypothetical protein